MDSQPQRGPQTAIPNGQDQPTHFSDRTLTLLRYTLVAMSALMVLLFLDSARLRLHFAFEYDWIEDGALATVRHLRQGLPLYQAPTVAFTPYLYTPIFFYVSAALSHVLGISYVTLRIVSIVSTLGCFAVIFGLVYQETRQRVAAAAAVGCFAACYPFVAQWFDIGRVDMLFLFFLLAALYATRRLHPVLAAILWVCAFQTKQGVLPVAILMLCHDWQRPRRVIMGLATLALGLGGSILWLSHVTGGWYRYYVFELAGSLGFEKHQALHYIPTDLLAPYGIAILIATAAFLLSPAGLGGRANHFYLLGTISLIVFTGYIRGHNGANVNSLLPAYVWVSILFGVGLARLMTLLLASNTPTSRAWLAILLGACSIQLMMHLYTPNQFVPRSDQVAWREGFENQIRSIPGQVLLINYPEDALAAGKTPFGSGEATGALIDAVKHPQGAQLQAQYADLIHSEAFSAVVLDRTAEAYFLYPHIWMPRDILHYYPLRVAAIGGEDLDLSHEPRWIYLSCRNADAARKLDPSLDTVGICRNAGM